MHQFKKMLSFGAVTKQYFIGNRAVHRNIETGCIIHHGMLFLSMAQFIKEKLSG
jgi:hypothetical protein